MFLPIQNSMSSSVVFQNLLQETPSEDPSRIQKSRGSVEIVEVPLTEDEELEKELNKSQIEDIVHTRKPSTHDQYNPIQEPVIETIEIEEEEDLQVPKLEQSEEDTEKEKPTTEPSEEKTATTTWSTTTESKESVTTTEETSEISNTVSEPKKEVIINLELQQNCSQPTIVTPEFTEDLFNELNVEIKIEKTNSVKRDYSRTKKKDQKGKQPLFTHLIYSFKINHLLIS